MERLTAHERERGIIDYRQIGFVKGLGGELNLMRFLETGRKLRERRDPEESSVLFIDFKQAYDSVDHQLLFRKLEKYSFPQPLINTIKKLYSFARIKLSTHAQAINVNRGLLQGSIISPILFNLFINDLITKLGGCSFETLAYADDVAIVCRTRGELLGVMDMIEKWAADNRIEINKKKSGIFILKNWVTKEVEIGGYPISHFYKYLGILFDHRLSPKKHILEVEKRLNSYLAKNKWLIKRFFSTKTLVSVCDSFQMSRLAYGMSTHLDDKWVVKKLEGIKNKFLKSIIGINNCTNSARFLLTLNIPRLEFKLFPRLLNTIEKYRLHYGEDPSYITGLADLYLREIGNVNEESLKKRAHLHSMNELARSLNLQIGENYEHIHEKIMFKYPDRRDNMLLMFYVNYGFFNARWRLSCECCGESPVSRTHVTNTCAYFDEMRKEHVKKLEEVMRMDIPDLEQHLMDQILGRFTHDDRILRKAWKIIKDFVSNIYFRRSAGN